MQDWQIEIEPLKASMIGFIQDWCESSESQTYSFDYAKNLFDRYLEKFSLIEQKKVSQALLETKIFSKILLENKEEESFFILTLDGKNLREDEVLQEEAKENFLGNDAIKLKPSESAHFMREVTCGVYDKILRIS